MSEGFLPNILNSFDIHVTLYPLYHAKIDDLNNLDFAFLPYDLACFITQEEEDSREQQRMLKEKESLGDELYVRYSLQDFYPSALTDQFGSNPYPQRKPWPGYPYAALRCSFRAHGASAGGFPEDIRDNLWQLSNLDDRNVWQTSPGALPEAEVSFSSTERLRRQQN
ncbi:hypothetical protein MMC28_008149 [Mycoblastus sanguinarius]|nr:hypothetical protein [Mycoblastus sanguinarius]